MRFVRLSAADNRRAKEAGATVNKRHQKSLADRTVNRVAFPIADAQPLFDDIVPLWDDALRLNGIVVGLPAAIPLAAAAQVRFCRNAGQFSLPDIAVDG